MFVRMCVCVPGFYLGNGGVVRLSHENGRIVVDVRDTYDDRDVPALAAGFDQTRHL